jgi:hypothetical protein
METSASMLQIIARMRKGGIAIIPKSVEIDSFYDGMRKIFDTIRDGRDEMLKVGPPRSTQAERQNQCILLALIQNLRYENNRPVVRNILTKLNEITKRCFEHECKFLVFDETLVNSITLSDLEGREPLMKMGQARWYKKIDPMMTYIVSLDPSLGTGGDPAAIQVFEANTTEQIAEWRHNRTDIPTQIRILADICAHINETVKNPESIYFSVENNTIGEASLISIAEYGEENIKGYFLSEPGGGGSRRYRKGFNTTHKPKLSACNKLKIMVESGRMKLRSSSLISELKTFVASGTGYAAKPGETDDLVMATVLAVRMLQLLQTYDNDINNQLRDHGDAIIPPMPFISVMR